MTLDISAKKRGRIRVAITEVDPILRAGMSFLLEHDSEFEVVACIGRLHEQVAASTGPPEVLLLGASGPADADGRIRSARHWYGPSVRLILLINGLVGPDELLFAWSAGADGVVSKQSDCSALRRAIISVRQNRFWMNEETLHRLIGELHASDRRGQKPSVQPSSTRLTRSAVS